VQEQAERGFHYGDNHQLEIEWAALIRRMMPAAERIEFCASGQEANALGFRLGRAVTGRRKVLRLSANYSGWLEELAGAGQPGVVADAVSFVPPNDLAALEQLLSTREYAVVLVEGGGGFLAGRVPTPLSYYQALPALARQYGTILLLDEVVTGFREAPGGWQSIAGITPDLTATGKAASGGLPSGILLGRADFFAPLDPDHSAKVIPHGGTWNAVPLTAAAGVAACTLYVDGAPQRAALDAAARIKAGCNEAMARRAVSGRLYGRSVLHFYFGPVDTPADAAGPCTDVFRVLAPTNTAACGRLELHLLHRGVATIRGEAMMLSSAHTHEDIDRTVAAFDQSIAAMLDEGTLPA
jgi:glutamate-1-semialdehyde 2,1-aminomutase